MKHTDAGILKRVSTPVYWKDVLSDQALQSSTNETVGAWLKTWASLELDDAYEFTKTRAQWGRLWSATPDEVDRIIADMQSTKILDVTLCNENVTLMLRRNKRRHKAQEQARLRVKRHREKGTCNADVTPPKRPPTVSSSVAVASSVVKDTPPRAPENPDDKFHAGPAEVFAKATGWAYDEATKADDLGRITKEIRALEALGVQVDTALIEKHAKPGMKPWQFKDAVLGVAKGDEDDDSAARQHALFEKTRRPKKFDPEDYPQNDF